MKTLHKTIKLSGIMAGVLMALALSTSGYGQVLGKQESKLYAEASDLKMGRDKSNKKRVPRRFASAPAAPAPAAPVQAPVQASVQVQGQQPAQPEGSEDDLEITQQVSDESSEGGLLSGLKMTLWGQSSPNDAPTEEPAQVPEGEAGTVLDQAFMEDVKSRFTAGTAAERDGAYIHSLSKAFVHLVNNLPSVGAVSRTETDNTSGITLPQVDNTWFNDYGMVVGNIGDSGSEGTVTLIVKFNVRIGALKNNPYAGLCGYNDPDLRKNGFNGFTVSISQTGGSQGWQVHGHPLPTENNGDAVYVGCMHDYGTPFGGNGSGRFMGTHTPELIEALLLMAGSQDGVFRATGNTSSPNSWDYALELLGDNQKLHQFLRTGEPAKKLANPITTDQITVY